MGKFKMKFKEIPDYVSKENPIWAYIELEGLEKERYSISTNGDIYDNKEQCEVSTFYYKDRPNKYAMMMRSDNICSQFNVTYIMMKTFVSDDVSTRNVFYFKDHNKDNLYIRNIGICRRNLASLSNEDISTIKTLINMGYDNDFICEQFNRIQYYVMYRYIDKIKNQL